MTLPITVPKAGQEPGHRATVQPGRADGGFFLSIFLGGVERVCWWLKLSGLFLLPALCPTTTVLRVEEEGDYVRGRAGLDCNQKPVGGVCGVFTTK